MAWTPERDERLADWVDGRLDDVERARFEAEMLEDPELRAAAEEYRRGVERVRDALRGTQRAPIPAPGLTDRIMARIEASAIERRGPRLFPILGSFAAAAAIVLLYFGIQQFALPDSAPRIEPVAFEADPNARADGEADALEARRDPARDPARTAGDDAAVTGSVAAPESRAYGRKPAADAPPREDAEAPARLRSQRLASGREDQTLRGEDQKTLGDRSSELEQKELEQKKAEAARELTEHAKVARAADEDGRPQTGGAQVDLLDSRGELTRRQRGLIAGLEEPEAKQTHEAGEESAAKLGSALEPAPGAGSQVVYLVELPEPSVARFLSVVPEGERDADRGRRGAGGGGGERIQARARTLADKAGALGEGRIATSDGLEDAYERLLQQPILAQVWQSADAPKVERLARIKAEVDQFAMGVQVAAPQGAQRDQQTKDREAQDPRATVPIPETQLDPSARKEPQPQPFGPYYVPQAEDYAYNLQGNLEQIQSYVSELTSIVQREQGTVKALRLEDPGAFQIRFGIAPPLPPVAGGRSGAAPRTSIQGFTISPEQAQQAQSQLGALVVLRQIVAPAQPEAEAARRAKSADKR